MRLPNFADIAVKLGSTIRGEMVYNRQRTGLVNSKERETTNMTIRPRCSLRILLSFVTVIAILLGWKTNREHEREQAIAALSRRRNRCGC